MEDIQKKLWTTEQEILDVFHDICISNNLRYSLAYGTLIGAVRHRGFIPWDDDIDVVMPRNDYEKLIAIWQDKVDRGYILQNPVNHPDLPNNFVKIRKDHTTFIMFDYEREATYQTGIFIDVFPLDRVAPNKFLQVFQRAFCAVSLLLNRGHTSGDGLSAMFEKCMLRLSSSCNRKKYECIFIKLATQWNKSTDSEFFGFSTLSWMKYHYPNDAFSNLVDLEFEGKMYKAFANYDEVLRNEYGDYMRLPPEVERVWKHHPLVIDFEHNYDERKDERI